MGKKHQPNHAERESLLVDPLIDQLINRRSVPATELTAPAPNPNELHTLFQAAASAPDHCGLRPWRFLVVEGEARKTLGEVFADAYRQRDPNVSETQLDNYRNKPLRAPMVIVGIASITPDNPKVPEQEQILSAGCAMQHIQLAAQAMGYGSVWLTGINTRDWQVSESLGLDLDEKIIGFLYLGTPSRNTISPPRPKPEEFVAQWDGPTHAQETAI